MLVVQVEYLWGADQIFQYVLVHTVLIWGCTVLLFANMFIDSICRYYFGLISIVLNILQSWVKLGCSSSLQEVGCGFSYVACEESQWHHDPQVHLDSVSKGFVCSREFIFLDQCKCQFIFPLLFAVWGRLRAKAFIAASYKELHCPFRTHLVVSVCPNYGHAGEAEQGLHCQGAPNIINVRLP